MSSKSVPVLLLALAGCSVQMPDAPVRSSADLRPIAVHAEAKVSRDPLDTIVFGDVASESAHGAAGVRSEPITGALGQPARRFLPLDPVDYYGGTLTMTMAVDPARRNYFSAKFWSEDDDNQEIGRIYLYIVEKGVDYQVGYRHEGDYMPLAVAFWSCGAPGRFFYSTTMLPLAMTAGKTSLTFKVVSMGRLYPHGHGGKKEGGNYQFLMDRPSRGIYRAYTHVNPLLDPTGEVVGTSPAATLRDDSGLGVFDPDGSYFKSATKEFNKLLGATPGRISTWSIATLAQAYRIKGLASAYQNPAVVDRVAAELDAYASDFLDGRVAASGAWGGVFGQAGYAIHTLAGELSGRLDEVVAYGTKRVSMTRRKAWGDMLYASREFGRHNRRTLSNQNFIADDNIYGANKGLLALRDARAFPEDVGQRYALEACGLAPWRGDDLADGSSAWIYGTNYFQVTEKGLTREWGYVGCGYGEMTPFAVKFYRYSGNPAFLEQAVKMSKARAYFRRPALELSGTNHFQCMQIIGELAWRGANESEGQFANEIGYAGRGAFPEAFLLAAKTKDPALIGYCKQMLEDHQYLSMIANSGDLLPMEFLEDLKIVAAEKDSGLRLPMTDGQPDFAWADEGDRILALKHGGERLWITPYWQAKNGSGINGVARFQYDTETHTQFGVLETVPQFVIGGSYSRPPEDIDKPEGFQWKPPEPRPLNAYGNEVLPLGPQPPGATVDGPSRGKADFYAFRFGRYLMGINASESQKYTLKTPVGFTGALDLVSGRIRKDPVVVAPVSSVALVLPDVIDAAPVPGTPLMVWAQKRGHEVAICWSPASGAESYQVKRSSALAGPYETIASGLAVTNYLDASVHAESSCYYRVSAANANGGGYDSAAARVQGNDVR